MIVPYFYGLAFKLIKIKINQINTRLVLKIWIKVKGNKRLFTLFSINGSTYHKVNRQSTSILKIKENFRKFE